MRLSPSGFQMLEKMPPLDLDPQSNARAALKFWSQGTVTKLGVATNGTLAGGTIRVDLGGGNYGPPRLRAIERARLKWGYAEVVA